mgnify:CR=1 FL=1
MNYLNIGLLSGFTTLIGLLWSSPMLVANLFGLKLCETTSDVQYNLIKNLLTGASIWKNQEPCGWIYGKEFIGYVEHYESTKIVTILAFDNFLETHNFINLSKQEIVEEKKDDTTLTIWMREGIYCWLHYERSIITFMKTPLTHQIDPIENILNHAQNNINTVALLHGSSGTGKSMIPMLIAKILNCGLIDSFNPTDPGDTMIKLINKVKPSKNKKIVIVLEEVDNIINNIHNNLVTLHKNIPTLVRNKEGWNNFLDKFDREYFQHVVLIMTTNKKPDYFDSLDVSYMRKGRVDLKISLDSDKNK